MRRFSIRTFGCQMNAHDSEKLANLLYHAGYRAADDPGDADLLIVNTCSIREKAEHRLYSDLGTLRSWKAGGKADAEGGAPGRILAVGGCVAQQVGEEILRRFPQVDFVFGTHNLRWVPEMARAAERGRRSARLEADASQDRFDLPERHPDYEGETPGRAYLTVMEGCDLFCSFCIVPRTRGREISRPAAAILAEATSLAERGVREITLLGQTVNAYGRHDRHRAGRHDRHRAGRHDRRHERVSDGLSFASLLARLNEIPGITRIRYTSPHPAFFDDDLIRAHGELEALCPHVHLPLQSGSDAVLERMRRRYSADAFRGIVEALRRSRPDIAITSDLIVAFPGETQADFEATLALVEEVGFVDSFSFKYSPRPGTAAAGLEGQIPPTEAQARLEALQGLQRSLTMAAHTARVGADTEILVEGQSRRGAGQWMGRDPYHRVVNVTGSILDSAGVEGTPMAGELVRVTIQEATPHSLLAVPVGSSTGADRVEGAGPGARNLAESRPAAGGAAG